MAISIAVPAAVLLGPLALPAGLAEKVCRVPLADVAIIE
jgi:hypothetical protein